MPKAMGKTELKKLLTDLDSLKATVISKGMPYNNVRNVDDVINVVLRVMGGDRRE